MTSRFITDENIPASVSSWLRDGGYDTERVAEALHKGATDLAIVAHASGQDRLIVTLDQDFIRLHRQLKPKFGVIVIRTHPPTPMRVQECLGRLFSRVDLSQHLDGLIVVSEKEIRIETS